MRRSASSRSESSTQPGSHARELALRVDLEDAVEVLREVDHDSDVAALPGEARAAAAREHRRTVLAARRDGRDDVVDGARDDDADRHLPVVRPRGRVEGAIADAEAHLALDAPAQGVLERARVCVACARRLGARATVAIRGRTSPRPASQLDAEPRSRPIGRHLARDGLGEAVEEEALDADMVVEPFEMAQVRHRGEGVRVDRRRGVPRDVELVRVGERRGGQQPGHAAAAGGVGLEAVDGADQAAEIACGRGVFAGGDVDSRREHARARSAAPSMSSELDRLLEPRDTESRPVRGEPKRSPRA